MTHLSPLDVERALVHKLTDSGARVLVTANFPALLPTAQRLLAAGHIDRLIVGDDAAWGPSPIPLAPFSEDERQFSFARLLEGEAPAGGFPEARVDDIALLQYTGGTTGLPKGAMLTHGNLTAVVAMLRASGRTRSASGPSASACCCVLPLFHIYALGVVLLRGLDVGADGPAAGTRFDVEDDRARHRSRRVTVFPGVPTMWIALTAMPGIEKRDLSSLRLCGSGGAPLPVEVAQRFERLTGHSDARRLGHDRNLARRHQPALARPASPARSACRCRASSWMWSRSTTRAACLRPARSAKSASRGRTSLKGYWNRPEETAKAFVDGFFLTGDIGYMDEDGYFFLVDRKKDMIISGGFNVYPQHDRTGDLRASRRRRSAP